MAAISERTIFRRMAEGLTREEAERSRKRKPGPKPKGSKRYYKRIADKNPQEPLRLDHEHCSIEHCDLRNLFVESESVQLVLTDPPYDRKSLCEWEALGSFAKDALAPGGFLVAYSGLRFLPEVLSAVTKHVPYCWTMAIPFADNLRPLIRGPWVVNRYKMVLIFRKRPHSPRRPVPDLLAGGGREKFHHKWQQALSESEQLIELFSDRGDLVVDPMVGGGTSAVAALQTGRRFVGCDRDGDAVATARLRVIDAIQEGLAETPSKLRD
jgi:hypothetical protein